MRNTHRLADILLQNDHVPPPRHDALIFDAEVNAAKNILKPGISPTRGLPGMACESSRDYRPEAEDARKSGC